MSQARLVAEYVLSAGSQREAHELADAIAREQTIEVPPGVGSDELQARMLGRIEAVESVGEGRFLAKISFSPEVVGTGLPQILNVAWGNVSLMSGVRLEGLSIPDHVLEELPGPSLGIDGMRALVGAGGRRALFSVAVKPVGRTSQELAELASVFARAGVDVIKDDHGLVDQDPAPFHERVRLVADAVAEANAVSGGHAVYFPNVTGPVDVLDERIDHAAACGCRGIMLCPSIVGLDAMRAVASRRRDLAIMAHPSHAQSAPRRAEGIAPEVLFGTLYRVAGADAAVYVNAEGRFAWPLDTCHAINRNLRRPLGRLRTALPTPAGGVNAADAARWLDTYGPDTMLLIGGSLLARDDVLAATHAVVEAAHATVDRQAEGGPSDE